LHDAGRRLLLKRFEATCLNSAGRKIRCPTVGFLSIGAQHTGGRKLLGEVEK